MVVVLAQTVDVEGSQVSHHLGLKIVFSEDELRVVVIHHRFQCLALRKVVLEEGWNQGDTP